MRRRKSFYGGSTAGSVLVLDTRGRWFESNSPYFENTYGNIESVAGTHPLSYIADIVQRLEPQPSKL